MAEVKIAQFWNSLDELGMLVGMERIEGESNRAFRKRIVNRKIYNSTAQGLVNMLSDLVGVDAGYIVAKRFFFSKYTPLTKHMFSLSNFNQSYLYPVINDNGVIFDIVDISSAEKDVFTSTEKSGFSWTIYKTITGAYHPIWEASYDSEEITLRYMTVIENELYNIEESAHRLKLDNGIVTEEEE